MSRLRILELKWFQSVTRYDLAKDIKGRQVEQMELIFSDRVSLY
jgi:hypothetical protein